MLQGDDISLTSSINSEFAPIAQVLQANGVTSRGRSLHSTQDVSQYTSVLVGLKKIIRIRNCLIMSILKSDNMSLYYSCTVFLRNEMMHSALAQYPISSSLTVSN